MPKSLADGIAMQNFVNDAYDVMIGVKRSEVFQNKNVTEIILVADEYGNQGLCCREISQHCHTGWPVWL